MLTQEIGVTAGEVYRFLAQRGEASLTQLQREVPASQPNLVPLAVGWLARENKLVERRVGRTLRLRLTD